MDGHKDEYGVVRDCNSYAHENEPDTDLNLILETEAVIEMCQHRLYLGGGDSATENIQSDATES